MTTPALPDHWAGIPQLEGFDLVDKLELIGMPFLIRTVRFETNKRGVSFVYVDAETATGEQVSFNDSSSTGIRQQIADLLTGMDRDAVIDTGETLPLALVIPRGLRISEFEVEVTNERTKRSEMKKARVFYLTKSGTTGASEPAPAPTSKPRTRPAKTA